MDEQELCELARRMLRAGRLPRARSGKLLAGYGKGELCAVCESPMTTADVVYELRVAPDSERTMALHFQCFAAWDRARTEPCDDPTGE